MKKPSKFSDIDLCVMCGMCLPNCPTYQLYQTETESPRGRLTLMQSIDQQRISPGVKAMTHIDHCLGCLNCETICPSQVPFGKLIDEFRDQYSQKLKKSLTSKLILNQSSKADGLENLTSITSRPILKQLLKVTASISGIPNQLIESSAQQTEFNIANFYPGIQPSKGEVSLFTGCTGKSVDSNTITDAITILNQLGFDVSIAAKQHCCGAMHQHNGQLETAKNLFQKNNKPLQNQNTIAILFFSPACSTSLNQLIELPFQDARSFIHAELQKHQLSFSPYSHPVVLHESCSHRNLTKLKNLNSDLLNYIPEIKIIESKEPALCCGAGGLQSFNYPEQASSLLQMKLQSFDLSQARILISDNIGCSLHIKSQISAYNPEIEILHPVSLMARQLKTQPSKG